MRQNPALNPMRVDIYRINQELYQHEFRNRVTKVKDALEPFILNLDAQVYFFAKEALRWRTRLGKSRSLGYIWFDAEDIRALGVSTEEDSWLKLRIKFPDLGERTFVILELRPVCHLDGSWLYWRADFEEDVDTDSPEMTERLEEETPTELPLEIIEQELQ